MEVFEGDGALELGFACCDDFQKSLGQGAWTDGKILLV